jgi:pseudouridine-5'-phosphate glycosidase/pseudouridine kinase
VQVVKVSRRDLAAALAQKQLGGTTVAATMMACAMAGIDVFATGGTGCHRSSSAPSSRGGNTGGVLARFAGIGGVHRDGHDTMDVSSDLHELGATPAAPAAAGTGLRPPHTPTPSRMGTQVARAWLWSARG